MYLKEITINGFKSFADSTRVQLDRGVTVIVGPNGCGKSNIVDAIRWVLGEQSAKALRGGKMQDVIFEGTDKRKPYPWCEVSLTFTDCEEQLGTAFNEVEISRRVSREGQSEYRLNGKICRLKDFQRLFMDTGVGRVSYSFMVQGQIDRIIASNPSERRQIFEEAAGITKYKSQRHETMNKLALVDQNLSRVTDVINEVERQINTLKRQASKALRYKKIKHRLNHLELGFFGFQFNNLKVEIDALQAELESLRASVEKEGSDLSSQESELQGLKEKRSDLFSENETKQQRVYDLRSEKEQAENSVELADLRTKDLSERLVQIEKELEEFKNEYTQIQEQFTEDSRQKEAQQGLLGVSDEAFEARNQDLLQAQEVLAKEEATFHEKRQFILDLESDISRLRSKTTNLEVELQTYEVKHSNVVESVYQLKEEKTSLEKNLETNEQAQSKTLKRQEEQTNLVEELKTQFESEEQTFKGLQSEIQAADRELATLGAKKQLLEELQEKFEGFSDGAKAILSGELEDVVPKDACLLIAKLLKVEEQFSSAAHTLLGPAMDALFLKDSEQLLPAARKLKAEDLGRACLQVDFGKPLSSETKDCPEWLVPASTCVSSRKTDFDRALSLLIEGCYFCESLDSFLEFWKVNPGFSFLFVATNEGDLIDCRGLVYAGGAESSQEDILVRENEIRALRDEVVQGQERLDSLREKSQSLQDNLSEKEEELESAEQIALELKHELSNIDSDIRRSTESLEKVSSRLASQEEQVGLGEATQRENKERLASANKELEALSSEFEAKRQELKQMEARLLELREIRDQKKESLAEVRFELVEKKQRLELINQNLGQLESKTREIDQRRVKREQEIVEIKQQVEKISEDQKEHQQIISELEEVLSGATKELEETKSALYSLENEIKLSEDKLSGYRDLVREKETALNKVQIRFTEKTSRLSFLEEKIGSEHQLEIGSVDWAVEIWKAQQDLGGPINWDDADLSQALEIESLEEKEPTAEDLQSVEQVDWSEIESEIKKLKDRIQSMGSVNLVAIEEYQSLSERFEFLKTQSEDLWNSKNELLTAIEELNKISQERFVETFEKVRENFKYTFNTLFGGGEADLILVDKEDVLDSGVDIIARPPGTKLKSLSLLSGGQKTMTAVGLLFAIYMVKPSPFCVLDELDAPLDDANIGRFTDMLKQFLKYSQFLIITHNKRTISCADAIYGVTMQEKGVSRLISMRFDHNSGKTKVIEDDVSKRKSEESKEIGEPVESELVEA